MVVEEEEAGVEVVEGAVVVVGESLLPFGPLKEEGEQKHSHSPSSWW